MFNQLCLYVIQMWNPQVIPKIAPYAKTLYSFQRTQRGSCLVNSSAIQMGEKIVRRISSVHVVTQMQNLLAGELSCQST